MVQGTEEVKTVGSSLTNGCVVLANLVYEGLPKRTIVMRHGHVKNAQGPELLYSTFTSRLSSMLFEETLRISHGHEVNTLTATAMGTATLSSRLSFTTSEP